MTSLVLLSAAHSVNAQEDKPGWEIGCYNNSKPRSSTKNLSQEKPTVSLPAQAVKIKKCLDLAAFPANGRIVEIHWGIGRNNQITKPYVKRSSGEPFVDLACLEAVCGSYPAFIMGKIGFTPADCDKSSITGKWNTKAFVIHLIPTSMEHHCPDLSGDYLRSASNLRILELISADPKGRRSKQKLLEVTTDWTNFLIKNSSPTKEQIQLEAKRLEEKYRLGKG